MDHEIQKRGNILLADYMGEVTKDSKEWVRTNKRFVGHYLFDRDWNWLMPVIEKISRMPLIGAEDYSDVCYPRTFNMPMKDGQTMFRFNGFQVFTAPTLIESAFLACVDFVEWELENKTKGV